MTLQVVTLEDRRAVYALLVRQLDWLPPARLAVGRTESDVKPGVGRWQKCETCDGQGRITGAGRQQRPCRQPHPKWPSAHGCRPCPAGCNEGYRRLHGSKAADGSDRMIKRVVGEVTGVDVTASYAKSEKRRYVDAQLLRIAALQRQHDGIDAAPDDLTRAHEAKEWLWQTGSFAALERAEELLTLTAPLRFEALRVYVIEQHFTPDRQVRERLDEIVDWLAARMPRPIRLPADAQAELAVWKHTLEHGRTAAHRRQREERNEEIRMLRTTHAWPVARLADTYALSRAAVYGILNADVVGGVATSPAA